MTRALQLSCILFFLLTSNIWADPYSELGRAPQDLVLGVGFDVEPKQIAEMIPEEPDAVHERMESLLWKHFSAQERLRGSASVTQAGFVLDLQVGDPGVLKSKIQNHMAENPQWEVEGASYQDYSHRLVLQTDRILFGEIEAVKSYTAQDKSLASKAEYKSLTYSDKADQYIYYLSTDRAIAPEPQVDEIEDPKMREKIDSVFGDVPSYPDLVIVSNRGNSLLFLAGEESIVGLATTSKSILDFYRESFFSLSLRTKLYVSIMPVLEKLEGPLSEGKSVSAAPIWVRIRKMFGLS